MLSLKIVALILNVLALCFNIGAFIFVIVKSKQDN